MGANSCYVWLLLDAHTPPATTLHNAPIHMLNMSTYATLWCASTLQDQTVLLELLSMDSAQHLLSSLLYTQVAFAVVVPVMWYECGAGLRIYLFVINVRWYVNNSQLACLHKLAFHISSVVVS